MWGGGRELLGVGLERGEKGFPHPSPGECSGSTFLFIKGAEKRLVLNKSNMFPTWSNKAQLHTRVSELNLGNLDCVCYRLCMNLTACSGNED